MSIPFTKMQACGNDFIVIDDRAGAWAGQESVLAERLCHRRFAIGADGLLVLREGSAADRFKMVFVNADGLIGEMCGNGARCLAAYIRRHALAPQSLHSLHSPLSSAQASLQLETLAGAVRVRFVGERIVLDLPPAGDAAFDIVIDWGDATWRFDAIDIGVPHAVCFVADRAALASVPVAALGAHVRYHNAFAPRGVNVNFVAVQDGVLYLRTYERGVEAETLGCGTGATAAALLAHARFGLASPTTVQTSSGEAVIIRFSDAHPGLQLEGGAHFVADGVLDDNVLAGLTARTASAPLSS